MKEIFVLRDNRGNYKRVGFYETFPRLELEAKAFAVSGAFSKDSSINTREIDKFVDKRFREFYREEFGEDYLCEELVRSEESCRVDLLKWGARWDKNSNLPYFEGHERADVVAKREEYVAHFTMNKDLYYYPSKVGDGELSWNKPMRKKRILLSHDESTFRSGETSPFRWFFAGFEPFFNKGRGRSIMVSAFIAMHSDVDVFSLNEEEWIKACENHPELLEEDPFLNYYPRSANVWIEPKKDTYFDNKIILKQFERLFILLKFKGAFNDHLIEIIVDNAKNAFGESV